MREGWCVRKLDTKMLGRRLAGKRNERGLTQQELHTRARVTQATISALEGGGRTMLTLNVLIAIAEVLEVSLDYLVYGEDGPPWKSIT